MSPSLSRGRVCITTYAGSIFCLRQKDGTKLWSTYVKRDAFRYDDDDQFPVDARAGDEESALGLVTGDTPESCAETAAAGQGPELRRRAYSGEKLSISGRFAER